VFTETALDVPLFSISWFKPKHHRFNIVTTHVTLCVCYAEKLLTYLLGGKTSRGAN